MEEYNKYQSQEWVEIQNEIEKDEKSPSMMDEFKPKIEINDYFIPKYMSRPSTDGRLTSTKKGRKIISSAEHDYLVNFKGYQMLVALYQGTDSHIGERCAYYLTDNGEIDMKFTMLKGEGSFMTSVLSGDVVGAIRRGSQEYRAILCDAIKERRLEI